MFLLRITGAFCPCRLNFCFATETTQKIGMPEESEESEWLFPTIQKDEKSLFPNSVSSIIPSNKCSFKEKTIRS